MKTTPRAVVFDLDGTLVDTADEFVVVVQKLREQYELPPLPAEQVRKSVSNGSGRLVTLALGIEPGSRRYERRRREFLDIYETVLGQSAQPYPGLVRLVRELSDAGIGWGVATNKPRRFAEPLMARMPFDPPTPSLVTPCDVSHSKPHPESIYLSCSNLKVTPEETIYVGDHQRDIYAGQSAGCFSIAATYGYIEDGDNPDDWGADASADSSEALADMIREMIA
jgi:2-phosphoglycolate phosphatase